MLFVREFMSHARIITLFATLAICASAGAQPLTLNLEAAYADTRTAMQAGDADIVCLGDSLTFRPDSYLPILRHRLQMQYGDGGIGYRSALPGELLTYTYSTLNDWWFGSLGPGSPPYIALDGLWSQANSPRFARARSVATNFRLHVLAKSDGGLWTASNGSGRFGLALDAYASAPEFRAFDLINPDATPIDFRPIDPGPHWDREDGPALRPAIRGESITILGGVVRSGSAGVRVHRVANGGWGVQNFLRRDFTLEAQLRDINPDLYLIMLGQNDIGTPVEVWRDRYVQLLDRLQSAAPEAEFVLIASYNSGHPALAQMTSTLFQIAQQRGVGFFNLYAAGGPYQTYVSNGYLSDPVHFNQAGGQYVGNLIYDALESAGRSATARCNDIDFNNNGVYPEDQDVIDFFSVLAGGACPADIEPLPGCDSIDFNRDNVFPDDQDIIDFFNVLSGGTCQ
jgi:lysophospholipase L1-like esterase